MYRRTLFRGAKTCKIGEKRCVYDRQVKENTCKNVHLGSIFIPEKYVFRGCFESPL